jgi:anaerobic selenocysteine-containing dehydrogenase
MPDISVAETQALVAKLYAPFESWWNSSAKPQGEARALAFIAAITSETIVQEVNNILHY